MGCRKAVESDDIARLQVFQNPRSRSSDPACKEGVGSGDKRSSRLSRRRHSSSEVERTTNWDAERPSDQTTSRVLQFFRILEAGAPTPPAKRASDQTTNGSSRLSRRRRRSSAVKRATDWGAKRPSDQTTSRVFKFFKILEAGAPIPPAKRASDQATI